MCEVYFLTHLCSNQDLLTNEISEISSIFGLFESLIQVICSGIPSILRSVIYYFQEMIFSILCSLLRCHVRFEFDIMKREKSSATGRNCLQSNRSGVR